MSNQYKLLQVLRAWGPPIVIMGIIFVASAQPKYEPPGGSETVYFSGAMPIFPGGWDFLIKKLSHVIAYGILAVLLMRALLLGRCTMNQAFLAAIAITLAYALSDEFHQAAVPGRNSSLMDIGFDLLGALSFSLGAQWLTRRQGFR